MGNKPAKSPSTGNSDPAVNVERSRLTECPEGIKKLNDSIWQLHVDQEEEVPRVDVIFFHGLQFSNYREAFWKTWLSRDESVVWPQKWLGPSLQHARILSVSYDSSVVKTDTGGVMEMYPIIENLIQDIALSPSLRIGQDSKVILVGHSLGGLIIKQLLLRIKDFAGRSSPDVSTKLNTFLDNCRGVFYYSTPHRGSELVAYAKYADRVPFINVNMKIIKFLRVMSNETARINNEFSSFRRNKLPNLTVQSIGETRETKFAGLSKMVVPEASARFDVDLYYSADADHFEVCKPENPLDTNIFTMLQELCETYTQEKEASR